MEPKINVSQSIIDHIDDVEETPSTPQDLIIKRLKSVVTSPTFIWFGSLYFTVLLSMISFNIFRVGFNWEGISGGPSYYSRLFLYYGLNDSAYYDSPYLHGLPAWFFAPFIAIWLGIVLFFMTMGGYAFNGTTFSDPTGAFFFAFFSENVYGFDINLFGEKGNLFYIGIVWLPILLSSIITIYYKNWVKRETSIITRFFVSSIIAFWVGIEMAKMTDASIRVDGGNISSGRSGSHVAVIWLLMILIVFGFAYYKKWLNDTSSVIGKSIFFLIVSFLLSLWMIEGYESSFIIHYPLFNATNTIYRIHILAARIWLIFFLLSLEAFYYLKSYIGDFEMRIRYVASFGIAFLISLVYSLLVFRGTLEYPASINLGGFSESMSERNANYFVLYSGEYHPTNLATVMLLYQIVILIIYSLLDNLGNLIRYSKLQYRLIRTRREMFMERRKQGILNLPWEIEDETQKVQSDKSKTMEVNQ